MSNFKPIKTEKVVISIRIDSDMLTTLDALANQVDISRNAMIIQCIDYAIKNFKP